jgi:NAD(P)-dependent dehydrogenase (short-subunit alcohol dehydrogenase family)
MLVDNLAMAEGARVIHTSAGEYKQHHNGVLKFDDLVRRKEKYQSTHAYASSKLMQIMYAMDCQRTWAADKKITSFSFDPGFTATNLRPHNAAEDVVRTLSYPVQRSVDQAALDAVYCALTEEALAFGGHFFQNGKPQDLHIDPETCTHLREVALAWTGLGSADAEMRWIPKTPRLVEMESPRAEDASGVRKRVASPRP